MSDVTAKLSTALADRYQIERRLGEGGMATVYLAQDLKHKRKVAVKVLRPELAAVLGAERFVQEITTTASLQHPNILPLFDSGEADGFLYYVMPYIKGETLRQKLDRETQLGIDEAVKITTDVADALDHAHRNGVIHRDIKPENILLHDGRPMIADFGIALAVSAAAGGRMTETGLSLGTPHYMSPEQATAEKDLTNRSDIYSLGSVLYEMLTGSPPHVGSSAQQIIMKIVTEEALPVTNVRKSVPPHVAAAVATSLEKLPADRFSSAAHFAEVLVDPAFAGTAASVAHAAAAPFPARATGRTILVALAVTVGLLAVVASWGWLRPVPSEVLRLGIVFPQGEMLVSATTHPVAISPDGSRIVYVGPDQAGRGGDQLWVRELSHHAGRPIPGTEQARAPFFSPDGEFVAFFSGDPGDVRVVPVAGGPVQTVLADSAVPWGGDWGRDGHLYVTIMGGRLVRMPARGGPVEVVSSPDTSRGETFHEYPHLHPNGKFVLIQIWYSAVTQTQIGVVSLETGAVHTLADGLNGRFLDNGDVIYATMERQLLVAPFDPSAMAFAASPVIVEEGVYTDLFAGVGVFAVSHDGRLVYHRSAGAGSERVVWVDRAGEAVPVDSGWIGDFGDPALSPDGSRLAVTVNDPGGTFVWVKELDRGPMIRITFGDQISFRSAWMPDGRSLVFVGGLEQRSELWSSPADGSGVPTLLLRHDPPPLSATWSPDGQWLVFRSSSGAGGSPDIMGLRPGIDSSARVFVGSPAFERAPAIAPDGRWIAYVANESGREEVYVRPFPDTERAKWLVSLSGGAEPRWAHSGQEIFYRTPRGELASRSVEIDDETIRFGDVEVLFDASPYKTDNSHHAYDVAPDDQRFLMIRSAEATSSLVVVFNWLEELKGR